MKQLKRICLKFFQRLAACNNHINNEYMIMHSENNVIKKGQRKNKREGKGRKEKEEN